VSVLWVEGIPDNAIAISNLLRDFPQQQVASYILSDRFEEDVCFYLASNDRSSSSLFQFSDINGFEGLCMDEQIKLNTFRFDEVFSFKDVATSHHLVLDVQGAELEVLSGFGLLLKSINSMKLEVSTFQVYEGAPLYGVVKEFLTKEGFILFG